jgi:hypothetical protein
MISSTMEKYKEAQIVELNDYISEQIKKFSNFKDSDSASRRGLLVELDKALFKILYA